MYFIIIIIFILLLIERTLIHYSQNTNNKYVYDNIMTNETSISNLTYISYADLIQLKSVTTTTDPYHISQDEVTSLNF